MMSQIRLVCTKLREAATQLPYLPRTFALVWAAAPRWTLVWGLLLFAQGLLPAASVLLTRQLVNSLVDTLGAGTSWTHIRPTLLLVLLMAVIMLLTELLRGLTVWIRTAQTELVQDHISALIHQRSIMADLAFYESPEYYDHLYRASVDAKHRPVALLEHAGGLLQNGLTLLAMGAVLLPFGMLMPVALFASTLPAFYVVLRYSVRQHQWRLRTTADERRTWYYDWLLTAAETAAEQRLFGLGSHFQERYQHLRQRLRQEHMQLAREHTLAQLGAGAVVLIITGAIMAWMVWRAFVGTVTLGDLALFYQAFNQGQRLMRSLMENVGQIYANMLFLGNLFTFLALEPQVVDPPYPVPTPQILQDGISFHNVTFHYPASERAVLHNFSLTLGAGQITAIVGTNGAGKSTLIKLLCRLYDPEQGSITFDGIDIRHLRLQELRRLITVLFQQPVHYNATVAENITLGAIDTPPERSAIVAAATAAGADTPIDRLPQGYETLLGKWFISGTELSVGEWQRLALARAFLRQAPIILLDEPTSAMDSWSEADWLQRFRVLAAGRTVVIITHRFTTAMQADIIHVMIDGDIAESGRHEELLARQGYYARSWARQMQQQETATKGVAQHG